MSKAPVAACNKTPLHSLLAKGMNQKKTVETDNENAAVKVWTAAEMAIAPRN